MIMESALLCVEGLHVDIVSTTPVKHMVRNVSFSVQRGLSEEYGS